MKSGSIPDIVHYLVNINTDREFLARFLLLFRQFMTPSDLLENLRLVLLQAPANERKKEGDEEDTVLYIQPVPGQSTVKQRVGYILNRWIQDYFDADFDSNAPLKKTFSKVAADIDPGLLVLLDAAVEKSKELRKNALSKQGVSMPSMSTLDTPKVCLFHLLFLVFSFSHAFVLVTGVAGLQQACVAAEQCTAVSTASVGGGATDDPHRVSTAGLGGGPGFSQGFQRHRQSHHRQRADQPL